MSEQFIFEDLVLREKARKEVLLRKYITYYNLKFALGHFGGRDFLGRSYSKLRDEITELKNSLGEIKAKGASRFIWLTVSLSPDWIKGFEGQVESEYLVPACNIFAQRVMFDSYIYVIEQRETMLSEKLYVGQHVHFLLRRNLSYCMSQCKRNSKNTWRKRCDVENSHIFNWHVCPESFIKDKLDYIFGKKTGEGKPEKVKIDHEWRVLNNIEAFYESPDKFFSSKNV